MLPFASHARGWPAAGHRVDRRRFLATPRRAARGSAGGWLHVARRAMACRVEITLPGEQPDGMASACHALDLVDQLEAQLSVYRATSALTFINRHAAEAPVPVDRRLFSLLRRAARLADSTEGAFDPTMGALTRCWGFFQRQGRVPAVEDLEGARAASGMRHVSFEPITRTIAFARTGVEINLGGIGKGYALDRAARRMMRDGTRAALLSAGGSSVRVVGQPPEASVWTIGLRDPRYPARRWALLHLRDAAVGTSGIGEQFFVHDGRRYGHLLDPRTGWPVEGRLAATVVTSSATDADALATACFVGGAALAERCVADRSDLLVMLHEEGAERPRVLGQHPRCQLEPLEGH